MKQHVAAAVAGCVLVAASPRGRRGAVMRAAGAALLGYALVPVITGKIRDRGARRRTLTARSSIRIDRPIGQVFSFFKDFESFPRVFGALRSVADFQDGRSHWEMYTPSGSVVAWDVVVTKYFPNSVIAWESVRGSPIEMCGIVRFVSLGPSLTEVRLEMVYRPAHTGLSDAVHTLLRRWSRNRLDTALNHARFYVESFPSSVQDVTPVA
jgi:uncharacterized membrane protein